MAADSAAKPASTRAATYRLVIRAEIIPEEPPQTAVPSHARTHALVLVVAGAALLLALIWMGIGAFRTHSPSEATADAGPRDAAPQLPARAPTPSAAAPDIGAESPQTRAKSPSAIAAPVEAEAIEAQSVASAAPSERAAPPSPTEEVIPTPPRSALQTIRGTVRVAIRVSIDKQGTVVAATSDDPGPSRYFERLALDAARKWTFAPARTDEPRTLLLRFHFTRDGITARTSLLQ